MCGQPRVCGILPPPGYPMPGDATALPPLWRCPPVATATLAFWLTRRDIRDLPPPPQFAITVSFSSFHCRSPPHLIIALTAVIPGLRCLSRNVSLPSCLVRFPRWAENCWGCSATIEMCVFGDVLLFSSLYVPVFSPQLWVQIHHQTFLLRQGYATSLL